MDPYVQNTARAQSDLFTVQCCHWDSKADGPSSHIVRAQSYLFTVQCWYSDSKADGPPMCKTLPEHRVISSLFNVVIETLKADGPSSQHCQSTELSLHCSMLSLRLKGRWTPFNTVRAQSDLFTVQCCHSDSNPDGPPPVKPLSEQRVISSLFNVVIETQTRWTSSSQTLSKHRGDLFTVQCCHSDSKADEPPSQHCQSTEWLLHCQCCHWDSKADGPLPGQHCQSSEWSLHCQCCQWDSKADGPQVNMVRVQSDLFTVQCCHWDSKADGHPQSTQSEHRFTSSLFKFVNETQSR